MEEFGCKRLIFSSSATVYGGESVPYVETMPAHVCTNPYGWTKVMSEQILRDYAAAKPDFSAVLLRYFNPIGAHESGLLGDDPSGIPNNLMPYVVRVAAGQLPMLTVFGDDYDTPDGTCLRDYLHVVDLARGHLCAIEYALTHTGAEAINLRNGQRHGVLELIRTFEEATGVHVPLSDRVRAARAISRAAGQTPPRPSACSAGKPRKRSSRCAATAGASRSNAASNAPARTAQRRFPSKRTILTHMKREVWAAPAFPFSPAAVSRIFTA